ECSGCLKERWKCFAELKQYERVADSFYSQPSCCFQSRSLLRISVLGTEAPLKPGLQKRRGRPPPRISPGIGCPSSPSCGATACLCRTKTIISLSRSTPKAARSRTLGIRPKIRPAARSAAPTRHPLLCEYPAGCTFTGKMTTLSVLIPTPVLRLVSFISAARRRRTTHPVGKDSRWLRGRETKAWTRVTARVDPYRTQQADSYEAEC